MIERTHMGQVYFGLGSIPHTRRDGGQTRLAAWASNCAECGRPFAFFLSTQATTFMPNRRCHRCARPGHRVKQAREHRSDLP